eukprot:CAMPEP_0171255804 /NCGR_PEP_ID=MMETSP0790-20130122/52963_1 /TAXON_ID=2925 /ORGANISM="Alexandrium catenella, Strain OF101" /LENGTH=80 /DNA_ID=CAMNT_0011723783 /DNA_START=12 /DNA_END=251 /DNA_ORIENTATION=-
MSALVQSRGARPRTTPQKPHCAAAVMAAVVVVQTRFACVRPHFAAMQAIMPGSLRAHGHATAMSMATWGSSHATLVRCRR